MIKVVAKNGFKAEDIDTVIPMIEEMIECTRKEDGCISYELFRLESDPTVLTFIETWESKESLDSHLNSEHFKRIAPKVDGYKVQGYGLDIYTLVK